MSDAISLQRVQRIQDLARHVDFLFQLGADVERFNQKIGLRLQQIAKYMADLEAGAEEHRTRRMIKQSLRIEAQSRAARLAKDARR